MIRTLVTGGTGFIGGEIVRTLVRASESVRVLSRRPHTLRRSQRIPGTEFVEGNIFAPADLEGAMQGCDAVINAVQFDHAPFENPRKGLTYEKIDGEGTELQVEAAKKAGVKRFIYMSGAGTREGRTEPWFRAKLWAEQAVRESGLDWTIFRPSWVYGPGDRSLNKFAMFARISPMVPVIGSGKEKIQPLFVDDLAGMIQKALSGSATLGKCFEVGGPQVLTMKEIVRTLLQIMNKRRLILPHPKSAMKSLAKLVQYFPEPLRFLTPRAVDFVTMEEGVDNSAVLEWYPRKLSSLADGLSSYLGEGAENKTSGVEFRTV